MGNDLKSVCQVLGTAEAGLGFANGWGDLP